MVKIRIVIADIEEIYREGLARLLKENLTFDVVATCRTGLEAVESVYKHQPDVILIDTGLPECSSVEVMQRIREGLSKTNIIVLTYSNTDDDLVSAARAGAKAYLSKDVSIGSLIKAVTLVAEGGIVISPPMVAKLLQEFNFLAEGKDATKLITLLSKREQAVLSLVAQGFSNREIATTLVISENTVKVHLRNIMEKLHAHTRQQAVSLVGGEALLPRVTQPDTKQA